MKKIYISQLPADLQKELFERVKACFYWSNDLEGILETVADEKIINVISQLELDELELYQNSLEGVDPEDVDILIGVFWENLKKHDEKFFA